MKKRILASLLISASLVLNLAACNSGSKATPQPEGTTNSAAGTKTEGSANAGTTASAGVPKELTLYKYYADSAIEQVDRALEFMKEHYPNLKINIEHRTDSDGSVLKTRAAVGELPDIFECSGQLTDIFVKSGDLYDLTSAFKEADLENKYIAGVFDAKKTNDGKYYAIQADTPGTYNLFYNKEVFKALNLEAPKNFEEMKNVVKTLKENGKIPLSLFAQQKWPGLQLFDMAVIGQGQLLGISGLEDGKHKITEEPYVKAAEKLYELVSLGMIGKGALNTNASQAFELLATDQAGMLGNGAWYFNDAAIGGYADKIGYLEYNPFVDPGDEEKYHYNRSGGQGAVGGFAVSAKGKYADYAAKVLMTFIEVHDKACAELGSLNVLKADIKLDAPRSESYQHFTDSLTKFETVSKYEWSLNNQELIVALEDYSELLLTGTYKVDKFISDLEGSIKDALK